MYYENPSSDNVPNASYFSGGLGADEQWTEPYMQYGEGTAESATTGPPSREDSAWGEATPDAKSIGGVAGSARQQANAVRGVSVHDGFPNPATDTSLQSLDLNSLLITHTATTYLMRLSGSEWQSLGIFDGDILIVDRSLNPRPNDLVVWPRADRFIITHEHEVNEDSVTWGVITATIHQFRRAAR